MKRFIKYLFITMFIASSCGEDVNSEVTNTELGDVFEIGYDENIVIESEALSLGFTDVNEDSRCPIDVDCIWRGRLTIELLIGDQKVFISNLDNNLSDPGNEILVNGYQITFIEESIIPIPVSTKSPDLDEYRVSLKIEKI